MKTKILVADDEQGVRELLDELLSPEYEVTKADRGDRAWEIIQSREVRLALLDLRMPGLTGIEIMEKVKEHSIPVSVIFITADKDIQTAIKAIKLGAFDYVTKPFDNEKILVLVRNALEKIEMQAQIEELRGEVEEKYSFEKIIGRSPELERIFQILRKVSPTDSTILITGESGTGKEVVARAVHYNSHRRNGPFVAVDCASIPDTLIENELFGHEKGAFTGALIKKIGKFELAHKGTIFLDEIGNLKLDVQAKLLRVLQEFEFARIGSNTRVKVDIRVIAATNADLEKKIRDGSFREDLYYRINVVNIVLPPLAKRQGDIVLLSQHFLEQYNTEFKKSVRFSRAAMDMFLTYPWPGNVRELMNTIQQLVVMNENGEIGPEELGDKFRPASKAVAGSGLIQAGMTIEEMEKVLIQETLKSTGFNLSRTARVLGVTRKTLHNKLDRYPDLKEFVLKSRI
jgi:DNA-binding NtrC family response regulator